MAPNLIVAIGERDIPGAKRFFGFIPLDLLTDEVDGGTIDQKASWYSGKNAQKCLVGGVYEAKCEIDAGKIRTIAFGRMKLQRRIDHPLTPAWAMSVQMDSPLYNTAHAVCVVRGEDPWMSHYDHIFGQLPRWQKVLIETALLKVIMG